MNGENQLLFTNEPVEVQDFRRIAYHFKGIQKIYLQLIKKNRKMSICKRLDLKTLRSQPLLGENRRLVTNEPVEFEK